MEYFLAQVPLQVSHLNIKKRVLTCERWLKRHEKWFDLNCIGVTIYPILNLVNLLLTFKTAYSWSSSSALQILNFCQRSQYVEPQGQSSCARPTATSFSSAPTSSVTGASSSLRSLTTLRFRISLHSNHNFGVSAPGPLLVPLPPFCQVMDPAASHALKIWTLASVGQLARPTITNLAQDG
jgi:hypothetical protein